MEITKIEKIRSRSWAEFDLQWAVQPGTNGARPWRTSRGGVACYEPARRLHHEQGGSTATSFCGGGVPRSHRKAVSGEGLWQPVACFLCSYDFTRGGYNLRHGFIEEGWSARGAHRERERRWSRGPTAGKSSIPGSSRRLGGGRGAPGSW
jgi:hypothetical protein